MHAAISQTWKRILSASPLLTSFLFGRARSSRNPRHARHFGGMDERRMISFVVDRMDRHPTRYSEGQVTSTTLPARMRYTYLLFVLTVCLPTLVQFNTAVGVVPGPSRTFSPAPMARTSTQSVSNSACAYTSKETTETTVPAHGSQSKAKYLGAIQTVSALPS
jgi:hypothetical protein